MLPVLAKKKSPKFSPKLKHDKFLKQENYPLPPFPEPFQFLIINNVCSYSPESPLNNSNRHSNTFKFQFFFQVYQKQIELVKAEISYNNQNETKRLRYKSREYCDNSKPSKFSTFYVQWIQTVMGI